MKFLECAPFDVLNQFLGHLYCGKSTLRGNLEAYICKNTGADRKTSFSLEHEILSCLEHSSDSDSSSPANNWTTKSSRQTLINLVLTLSHMYPDYDFSTAQAHCFFREEGWESFKQIFETYMSEAAEEWALNNSTSLLGTICQAIDDVVKLDECDIYSYSPDFDGDPFLEKGSLWSFNFFFYNKKVKRLVTFRFCCLSNLVTEDFISDQNEWDEVEDMFTDMDM